MSLTDIEAAEALPKIELHLHLDGSLSPEFMARQSAIQNIPLPVPPADIRKWLIEQKTKNLHKKLEKSSNWFQFDFCNQFLQTKSALKEATIDLLRRLLQWNVVYAEIRFCPQLHVKEGLSLDEVVESVYEGLQSAPEIEGGLVVCALRSMDSEHAVQMAELAHKHRGKVVGFDICGFETDFPLHDDTSTTFDGVKRALELGVPVTIHAGEFPDNPLKKGSNAKNVEFALKSGAKRIGHGIAIGSDKNLLHLAKHSSSITSLEVCLTSNVAFGNKVDSYEVHPVKKFFEERIPFSLSCDNLLLSGDLRSQPSPVNEILHLAHDVFKGEEDKGWEAVRFALECGSNAAFCGRIDQEWRRKFLSKVDDVLAKRKM